MKREKFYLVLALMIGFSCLAVAQKKELDHSVYDSWKSINRTQLSPDGKILSYLVSPQQGDGTLVFRRLVDKTEIIIPRGYDAKLSPDGRWAYCLIKPLYAETRSARISKKSKSDMPKDSLAYIDLLSGKVSKIPEVISFKTGMKSMSYLACLVQPSHNKKEKRNDKHKDINNLLLIQPSVGRCDTVRSVEYYEFSKPGNRLALTVKPDKKDSLTKSAVELYDFPSMKRQTLSTGKAFYSAPAFDDKGQQLAFLASSDTTETGNKHCSLYLYNKGIAKEIIDQNYSENLPKGWSLNENTNPCFSSDGNRLFVGVAPYLAPKDTSIVDFETAQVDIWTYHDQLTPPQQKLMEDKLKKQTYMSVINLNKPSTIVPLTTSQFDKITLLNEGMSTYALSSDRAKYMIAATWDANNQSDIALVNLNNGSRRVVAEKLNAEVVASPSGKYLLWYNYDDTQFYCYNVQKGTTVCLTNKLGVNFFDEENDRPQPAYPYCTSPIWTDGDEAVLINDRYDMWKLQPDGKYAINLSKGEGRKKHFQYRYVDMVKTDFTQNDINVLNKQLSVKKNERMYLTAFDEDSKKNGMAMLSVAKPEVPEAFVDTFSYTGFCKAKDADVITYQKGNFSHCYNLFLTSNNWKTEECLTDVNPQMKDYRWGSAHLVNWKAYDGTPLKGILYVPDGIDVSKKYPVMIYFYEKHSETLYDYIQPQPSWSTVNIAFYCSRGYLVFVPDIVYKVGHPGESAYNCIVSGAESICNQFPFADKSNMAIQGQSWGGYQVAYLITRTNLFKAAEAGAPVSNMTSAYGGIRWESGIVRAFQYEKEQSRIGKSLWDKGGLDLYLENSPLFYADKIETPLLIMHNDADGAVPWYQGIEYFSALRRLGKKVWMMEYNNEAHNLKERRNRKDLTIRLQQYFDYYLKGAPMPAWMKKGIPVIKKGVYFGLENAEN